jgi:uncharacterized protein
MMKNTKIIGIDIDGTVADTGEWFAKALSRATGKQLGYLDISGHGWVEEGICTPLQCEAVLREYWDTGYMEVEPMEGARRKIRGLLFSSAAPWEIIFVTARPIDMHDKTEEWLCKHDFYYDRLICTGSHNKHELPIDFSLFIEDRYETALAFAEKGVPCLLIDNPWNAGKPEHDLIHRCYGGWEEVGAYISEGVYV